jgi:hypothetical protein
MSTPINSTGFRILAKKSRETIDNTPAERVSHCLYVANLLDEIAARIERLEPIDAAPALDILYSWQHGLTISEIERLAVRSLDGANLRPVFSAIVPHPSTLRRLPEGHPKEPAVAANG